MRFLSCLKEENRLNNKTMSMTFPETKVSSLTRVNSDVLNESRCASGSIVAVAALELAIIGPLKTIH